MERHTFIIIQTTTPQNLADTICSRLHQKRKKQLIRYLTLSSIISLTTIGAAIYLSVETYHEMQLSGLTEYLSLLFSDSSAIADHVGEFGLAIIESLPIMAGILFCTSLGIFLISTKSMSKHAEFIMRNRITAQFKN